MNSIFLFRRSLRLADNIGLINCAKKSKRVFPIFIFTKTQIDQNKYKSDSCVQFMVESLKDLNQQLEKFNSKLILFYGENIKILKEFILEQKISCLYINKDYTPFSKKRDHQIKNLCKDLNVKFIEYEDVLLYNMGTVLSNTNTPYKVYSHFRQKSKLFNVSKPNEFSYKNFVPKSNTFKNEIDFKTAYLYYKNNQNNFLKGGRTPALQILKNISKFHDYGIKRDFLNYNTSHLSPYLKFGCVSIREVYHTIKNKLNNNQTFLDQLCWRDFYYNIVNFFPEVIGNSMHKYNIEWENNMEHFKLWCNGTTGFPIVDACMRQLNKTGYMPNRGRLIVASFLTKLLLIDWKKGEQYFATKLIDYDVAVNNGNWQWVAGTGVDRQQYNRIFNPWLQGEKFDPEAQYIKKWVPELNSVAAKIIHSWDKYFKNIQHNYLKPIIDYKTRRKIALEKLKK